MPDNLARLVENVIHSIEDSPESYVAYTVECGAETYQVKAIDSYVAERKGRKLFYEQFGFYPTHVKASVAKAPVAPVAVEIARAVELVAVAE